MTLYAKEHSVPITVEQNESESQIIFQGSVNIAAALDLKALLVQALAGGRPLVVNFSAATDLDVTAMQLLRAAEQAARKASVNFTVTVPLPESIAAAFLEAGLAPLPMAATYASLSEV